MYRYLLPLLFLMACSSPAPESADPPSPVTITDAPEYISPTAFKLPPTDPIAIEHNAIIDRAVAQGYAVNLDNAGYFYEILEPGDYGKLAPGDLVTVDYEAYYLDGTLVDKSKPGRPLRFRVGDLIEAWNLALTHARPGGSIRILTPTRLAYGPEGLVSPKGDTIVGANRALEFVIRNIEIHEE